MFYLSYIVSELRRRAGRTVLTALGLAVGVALVICVNALSSGLDKAQDEVLEPLTGVGTDMSVTRPLNVRQGGSGGQQFGPGQGGGLSEAEQKQLREENGGAQVGLDNLGDPGDRFEQDNFVTMTQLSFDESEVEKVAGIDGVAQAAAGLTLTNLHVEGVVPEGNQDQVQGQPPAAGGGPPENIDVDSRTVSGVDETKPGLGLITPSQVSSGEYFSTGGSSRQAILNVAYARRNGITVGETVSLDGKRFRVIGLATSPLGGQAADVYLKLSALQKLADREGRVNTLQVRADSTDDVAAVSKAIERDFEGASVTTSSELADRVGGSLVDAKSLSSKLGTVLVIVGLAAAVLIACLLTLASVNKRIRELGTLKAIGWPQRLVVRQVAGESLGQGLLGGLAGAALGVAGAALIGAFGPTLEATVAAAQGGGAGLPGAPGGGFGQGQVTAGSTSVALDAPVDPALILVAIALAILGGLIAGAVGGLRAARLRPADALRHID